MAATGSEVFFQIAATVMPALAFGGVLIERLRSTRTTYATKQDEQDADVRVGWNAAFAGVGLVTAFTLVEASAIRGAVGDYPGDFGAWLVAGALVLVPSLLFLLLLWPSLRRRFPIWGILIFGCAPLLVGVVYSTARLLHGTVGLVRTQAQLGQEQAELKVEQDKLDKLKAESAMPSTGDPLVKLVSVLKETSRANYMAGTQSREETGRTLVLAARLESILYARDLLRQTSPPTEDKDIDRLIDRWLHKLTRSVSGSQVGDALAESSG